MSLEANPASTGIVDVTKGNNSFVFDNGSGLTDVVGFHATGGYDLRERCRHHLGSTVRPLAGELETRLRPEEPGHATRLLPF